VEKALEIPRNMGYCGGGLDGKGGPGDIKIQKNATELVAVFSALILFHKSDAIRRHGLREFLLFSKSFE
jgi:hypothetical protein